VSENEAKQFNSFTNDVVGNAMKLF